MAVGDIMPVILEEETTTQNHRPGTEAASSAPSVIGTLVIKEVHDLVLTMRFSVGTVVAVTLAVLAAYMGSLDFNARLDSYQTKLKLNEKNLRETTVYSRLTPTVVRPPEPLSILNHGLEGRVGTDFYVAVDTESTEAQGENRGNEYLAVFSEVDLTVVVGVILGLLALLFTFDSICGEREAGTLKLSASYAVPRWKFLLSKYLGAWITLMLPGGLACGLSLLVVMYTAHVSFTAADAIRIVLLSGCYVLYLSLMLLVGLGISGISQRPSIALVTATFVWFVFVTVIPNLASMVPDFSGNRTAIYKQAQDNIRASYKEEETVLKEVKDPRDGPFTFDRAATNNGGGPVSYECRWGQLKFYDKLRDYFSRSVPVALRFASRRAEYWRVYIHFRERQAAMARMLAFLSPEAVLQSAATFLTSTSAADYAHFVGLASQYRNTYLGYLQSKNAFGAYRWFTEDPPDQDRSFPMLLFGKTPEQMVAEGKDLAEVIRGVLNDPVIWKKLGKVEEEDRKRSDWFLALNDLPRFSYARMSAGQSLVTAAPEIGYLLLLNAILFFIAFVRFVKYDVR
jgi:ABC-2 family transporter protein